MAFASGIIVAVLVFLFFVYTGGIILQFVLAGRKNKWLGLILPIISFLFSISSAINCIKYGGVFTEVLSRLFYGNIYTLILLIIYVPVQKRAQKRRAMQETRRPTT